MRISNNKFENLALCKTKLEDNIVTLYSIPNYLKFSNWHFLKGYMCTCIIISWKYRPIISLAEPHIQTIFVESNIKRQHILVGCIFRPSHGNIYECLNSMSNILHNKFREREREISYLVWFQTGPLEILLKRRGVTCTFFTVISLL